MPHSKFSRPNHTSMRSSLRPRMADTPHAARPTNRKTVPSIMVPTWSLSIVEPVDPLVHPAVTQNMRGVEKDSRNGRNRAKPNTDVASRKVADQGLGSCARQRRSLSGGLSGAVANSVLYGGHPVGCARHRSQAICSWSASLRAGATSASAEAPIPNARSTMRASPRISRVQLKAAACPLRKARISSNPRMVA